VCTFGWLRHDASARKLIGTTIGCRFLISVPCLQMKWGRKINSGSARARGLFAFD
jgi:hypothetical protein